MGPLKGPGNFRIFNVQIYTFSHIIERSYLATVRPPWIVHGGPSVAKYDQSTVQSTVHSSNRVNICVFRKQHNIDNVDISDISVNFVFQYASNYQFCRRHISLLTCNY